ncbi:sensor histidine kinase [Salinirussus salinus]|jgi:PAS domain S-box-containing protein|uniref:sensor histidine kinase n=1 Tax=Salinirussus salinus TaxID=1198300 RepID=UPI00135C3F31|nr:ATP-binding protein [Salinirussus salinus]
MGLSKRGYAWLGAGLAALLSGLVARDIYVDWAVEGKPLWSTLVENAVPLALGGVLFLAVYWTYSRHDADYVSRVTRWQYVGAVGIFGIVGWVVALQLVQGELKPYLLVLQTSLGGAVAGTVVGYATANLDEARRTVERERDRFEALFENAPAEVVDCRVGGDELLIDRANGAFLQATNLRREEAVGSRLSEVVAHEEATIDEIRRALADREQLETETVTPTDDGRRYFQVRVVPYGTDRGYVVYTDVTDLKETQRELETAVDQLERSNDRLQQFAYVASHDLQEPLRMISSYVDLLATEYGDELGDEADEYIEYAVDGAERMQDMIDGLLDYSRVRSQGEAFTEVDAATVAEQVRRDLELLAEEHGATVTVDDLPTVEADRDQLAQVFRNLVENALEHGGTTVRVGAERRDDAVVFSVDDDGPGIPEDEQDAVFDLFEQRDRDSDGTGMGLAICRRIVDRHGGDIWVESEPGEGTTFRFSVPD